MSRISVKLYFLFIEVAQSPLLENYPTKSGDCAEYFSSGYPAFKTFKKVLFSRQNSRRRFQRDDFSVCSTFLCVFF